MQALSPNGNHRNCYHEPNPDVRATQYLKKLVLQGHITLRFKTNACTEDIGQGTSLLSKCIDDWCSWRGQWSLQHVAENAKHAVEVLEILGGGAAVG